MNNHVSNGIMFGTNTIQSCLIVIRNFGAGHMWPSVLHVNTDTCPRFDIVSKHIMCPRFDADKIE